MLPELTVAQNAELNSWVIGLGISHERPMGVVYNYAAKKWVAFEKDDQISELPMELEAVVTKVTINVHVTGEARHDEDPPRDPPGH